MKHILTKLQNNLKLERNEAQEVMGGITDMKYSSIQIAAFVSMMSMRPITVEEILGFRDALIERCEKIDLFDKNCIDIVGTGGDGKQSFNISTTSAFIIAGAGYKVCKHGNYGVSSFCGSSNVLESLGYKFNNDPELIAEEVDKKGITFVHAPLFHPSLKNVAEIRKMLQIKTLFNIMGPLVNPATPNYQLSGTFDLTTAKLYQQVFCSLNRNFVVVYGQSGYDEISLTDPCHIFKNDSHNIINPLDFGMNKYLPNELLNGKTLKVNAEILTNVLQNKATEAQTNVCIANSAMAISLFEPTYSLQDCVNLAKESIESGKAFHVLTSLIS